MINFSLMGAGRIGKMHASIINAHPECNLKYIFDTNIKFASDLANKYSASITNTADEALIDNDIDAVLIASATPTHIEFMTKASQSGKAVFCEKPIDLDLSLIHI